MNKDLTCEQVSALINFYLEGKLNPRMKECINLHMKKCETCRKKIENLKRILNNLKKLKDDIQKTGQEEAINSKFINDLSAYVDNELNENENIKIKKMTISNPFARKELEKMYKFKKLLHMSYEKTKNENKIDYSRNVMSKIHNNTDYTTTYFYKLSAMFILLVATIIAGFIYLYF